MLIFLILIVTFFQILTYEPDIIRDQNRVTELSALVLNVNVKSDLVIVLSSAIIFLDEGGKG